MRYINPLLIKSICSVVAIALFGGFAVAHSAKSAATPVTVQHAEIPAMTEQTAANSQSASAEAYAPEQSDTPISAVAKTETPRQSSSTRVEMVPVTTTQTVCDPLPASQQKAGTVRTRGDDDDDYEGSDDGYAPVTAQSNCHQVTTTTMVPKTAADAASQQTPAPQQVPAVQPAVVTPSGFKNGTYTGSAVNNGHGIVQVQAVISGGKITDVVFLQIPSGGTSSMINTRAMPLLKQQAIAIQSANVSGVSGASDTSAAFIESLGAALTQAKA